ncbi:LysR family transcriptional regulator [Eubacteriales bacterium OttesenSCG-928-K08]|nr:LysR family transcriptional regulator [Eubacteriales bacterium OttesenSCG-928-K08]
MNDRQLRYILEIAKTGSMTAAAKNLYISQPSLSNLLASVESDLDAKLFNRNTSIMTLTYAGEKYIEAAEKILGAMNELQHQLDDIKESNSGRIHIGCGPQQSPLIIPCILPELMARFPNVQFTLSEECVEQLETLLLTGILDVVLIGRDFKKPNVTCIPITTEEMVILGPRTQPIPTNANSKGKKFPCINMSDLEGVSFVLMKSGHQLRLMQNRILDDCKFTPNVILETDNWQTCLRMVESGMAFSLLPNAKAEINTQRIVRYSLPKDYYRYTYICYRNNAYRPKIFDELIRIATKALDDLET